MESTLSLKISDIQAKLGTYAGWGRGALFGETAWTTTQQAVIDDATQSGYRRFLFPEPQEGSREAYAWSFLRPSITLTLIAGASKVPLPDDFGGIEGQLTIQSTSGVMWGPINICNQGEVDAKFSVWPTTTGKPVMACVKWRRGNTSAAGQRAELYVWPLADGAYNIRFQYYVLPDFMDATKAPYALGGMAHSETVLESCLAVMEERLDDIVGVHAQAYEKRLQASISMDRRSKAQNLGYNRDGSDDVWCRYPWNHTQNPILYNGTEY